MQDPQPTYIAPLQSPTIRYSQNTEELEMHEFTNVKAIWLFCASSQRYPSSFLVRACLGEGTSDKGAAQHLWGVMRWLLPALSVSDLRSRRPYNPKAWQSLSHRMPYDYMAKFVLDHYVRVLRQLFIGLTQTQRLKNGKCYQNHDTYKYYYNVFVL